VALVVAGQGANILLRLFQLQELQIQVVAVVAILVAMEHQAALALSYSNTQ
jgi:hypothetical protein